MTGFMGAALKDDNTEVTGQSGSEAGSEKMGWLRGFEPPASWTTTRRSNQLSYSHHGRRMDLTLRRRICVDI